MGNKLFEIQHRFYGGLIANYWKTHPKQQQNIAITEFIFNRVEFRVGNEKKNIKGKVRLFWWKENEWRVWRNWMVSYVM